METRQPLKKYTFAQVQDEFIGKIGTPRRDRFEFQLRLELLSEMIKKARKERNLTQEELGKLVGVQKAQISKLETSASNVSIDTVLRIFKALNAKVHFVVELEDQQLDLAA